MSRPTEQARPHDFPAACSAQVRVHKSVRALEQKPASCAASGLGGEHKRAAQGPYMCVRVHTHHPALTRALAQLQPGIMSKQGASVQPSRRMIPPNPCQAAEGQRQHQTSFIRTEPPTHTVPQPLSADQISSGASSPSSALTDLPHQDQHASSPATLPRPAPHHTLASFFSRCFQCLPSCGRPCSSSCRRPGDSACHSGSDTRRSTCARTISSSSDCRQGHRQSTAREGAHAGELGSCAQGGATAHLGCQLCTHVEAAVRTRWGSCAHM